MKSLLTVLNIFGGAVVLAALLAEGPLPLYTKSLLIASFIILPPLNLFAFFRRKPGLFIRTFTAWFRLACPTRKEEHHRK